MIEVKVKLFEVDQAIECAVINFGDSVGGEIETDQIFASIETFNRHNLIASQINLLDKHPSVIEALDLGDVTELEVDLMRLTNINPVITHLNSFAAGEKLVSILHILGEEVPTNQLHLEPLLLQVHGNQEHVHVLLRAELFG